MARQERTEQGAQGADPFELRPVSNRSSEKSPQVHIYGGGAVCETDKRGYASPEGRSPLDLVLDASGGFIPLWARSTTLRWRFQERSLRRFRDPSAAKSAIRRLFGEALLAWGDAVPVRFAERQHLWDFEIVTLAADDCDCNGCVLTSAFFPGGGQQRLSIYPKMFTLPRAEQVETLCHELGHVFGLRHFFAQIQEGRWPS
ncbi:MAG: matrix metalloproteinase-11, partial [Armatimonadetes bacterium]|nr:matrix metalloproteinase-11 [Armatimonadota bacterium]